MADIIERGRIYFFYRPKVQRAQPRGFADVQRLQLVLSSRDKEWYRVIVVGHKQLPDPRQAGRARFWGYVESAGRDRDRIKASLTEEIYDTKTRGRRYQPASRPAGEGSYAFVDHDRHMHFIYELELPEHPGPVQSALNIQSEASYIVAVKDANAYLESDQPRFVSLRDPATLNEDGTEIVLISASADISAEFDIDIRHDQEDLAAENLFQDLRLHHDEHPTDPLIYGLWA